MKKIVLDTNAYTGFLAGNEQVLNAMAAAEIVFLSVFVLGELLAGFKGGNKEAANLAILSRFLGKPGVQILSAGETTAFEFGRIKAALKKAGTPLPINDVWIAAHVVETGASLVTYDRHFEKIIGLPLWQAIA